jgi:hypothetical protein
LGTKVPVVAGSAGAVGERRNSPIALGTAVEIGALGRARYAAFRGGVNALHDAIAWQVIPVKRL